MIKRLITYVTCFVFALSGCVSSNPGSGGGSSVGPLFSGSFFEPEDPPGTPRPKLDVIIPVFDPGIPEDEKKHKEEFVWPELRRAESVRFAMHMKKALEETEQFGAVRVTPDANATGDLYILGKIVKSTGKDVEFDLKVVDVAGKSWFSEDYEHEVSEAFHGNIRNEGKDPYEPAFQEAAADIVEELEDLRAKRLEDLQKLTEVRFGASFSEESFAQYLKQDNGRFEVVALPSDEDPMLNRVRAIRVRDQLYVDGLQTTYQNFSAQMQDSYTIWQEQALQEAVAREEAEQEAMNKKIGGILLIGLGIAAAVAGSNSGNSGRQTLGTAGAILGGVGGAALLADGFQTSEEAKVHRDALNELGKSMDVEIAPQVVEFENKTAELTGNAKEQFQQWRAFLKEIFAQEQTPDVAL
ncbi:hypothetical protein [Aestuariispira insulae]|uniref:Lipoprotein n=1 Tax=Aestuariispira insulae TaxID=1461337 RepID=A0A3D9H5Y8_9PROT|nr:hypothetical protein [Aestuariispira insulae]RED44862.1 hypothetical protein DFP90_11367 [Aestuariispira insulae]